MENFILVVHVLIALAIIGLIMLQQGKGAEMGASFGSGSSQTVFGAVGSGNFFSRLTAILVCVFFVTSFTLAIMAKQKAKIDEHFLAPTSEAVQPADAAKGSETGTTTEAKGDAPVITPVQEKPADDAGALEAK